MVLEVGIDDAIFAAVLDCNKQYPADWSGSGVLTSSHSHYCAA